jgi:hypothetical protein
MKLRTSKALKYFAILLFSFEMMGAALFSSNDINSLRQDNHRSFLHSSQISSALCSFVFEENEGEEEAKGSKDHAGEFDFREAFIEFIDTEVPHIIGVESPQAATSQPSLFTLFHSYLI